MGFAGYAAAVGPYFDGVSAELKMAIRRSLSLVLRIMVLEVDSGGDCGSVGDEVWKEGDGFLGKIEVGVFGSDVLDVSVCEESLA